MGRNYPYPGRLDLDYALLGFLLTLATLFATLAFRKRIGRALLKLAFESIRDDFFEFETVTLPNGHKAKRRVPNERMGGLMADYAPGLMDWASKNIKIKLPPLTLPEGMDLKQIGMSAIGQKVLSGKKLNWQDAVPLGLGYVKDALEGMGILDKLKGIVKPKAAASALTPEAQAIVDKALNP